MATGLYCVICAGLFFFTVSTMVGDYFMRLINIMPPPFSISILNLPESTDRMHTMETKLQASPGLHWNRIDAIDGSKLSTYSEAVRKEFLQSHDHLLHAPFKSIEFKQQWTYTGTLETAFPGLNRDDHHGYKGLTLSNMRAMQDAMAHEAPADWLCIAEDDAELDAHTVAELDAVVRAEQTHDILWLDARCGSVPYGGSALICYHKTALPQVAEHMHPLSEFSRTHEEKYGRANLWDWQLADYTARHHKVRQVPLVRSGSFPSIISPTA